MVFQVAERVASGRGGSSGGGREQGKIDVCF